jgi:hypothetical protein
MNQRATPATRAQVRTVFDSITTPWAGNTRDRVLHGLDQSRTRWTDLHRDACVVHRRGEQSESLLDRRMLCLRKHLGDLQSAVSVLSQVNTSSAENAIDVIAHLPSLEECADVERLQSQSPPPPIPAQYGVARVRASLSQVAALDQIGRNASATALATSASAEAEQIGYAPLIADAALARGRVLQAARDMEPATAVFELRQGLKGIRGDRPRE